MKLSGTTRNLRHYWHKSKSRILERAKTKNIPFNLTVDHLISIMPTHCPVFGKEFVEGNSDGRKWSPSVDRIDPSLGYIIGNVQIISRLANSMKQHATEEEMKKFAQWILNTKTNQ